MQSLDIYNFILAQADPAPSGVNPTFQFVIMGLFIAGMWFLLIAPQRKKQKEHDKMLGELKAGDSVMTNGGIFGVIAAVKPDRMVLKVADNARIEIHKNFIQNKIVKTQNNSK